MGRGEAFQFGCCHVNFMHFFHSPTLRGQKRREERRGEQSLKWNCSNQTHTRVSNKRETVTSMCKKRFYCIHKSTKCVKYKPAVTHAIVVVFVISNAHSFWFLVNRTRSYLISAHFFHLSGFFVVHSFRFLFLTHLCSPSSTLSYQSRAFYVWSSPAALANITKCHSSNQ